jgi:hypothetical protein
MFSVKTFGALATVIFPYGPSCKGFASFLSNDIYRHAFTTTVIESLGSP